jgi:WD40 repeat protein
MHQPSVILGRFETEWRTWLATGDRAVDKQPQLTLYVAQLDSSDAERAWQLVKLDLWYRVEAGEAGPLTNRYLAFPVLALSEERQCELVALEAEWRESVSRGMSSTVPGDPETPRPPANPDPGEKDVLGVGGMGIVYRDRDEELGRDVARKVLKEELYPYEQGLFIREAQILARLEHPGIVPIYALGRQQDDRPYFTMKEVKGETLAKRLSRRKDAHQELADLIDIFEQICQTVAYAHSQDVLHRDLKPANIMVGAFGETQVMDWGLGKQLEADESEAGQRETKSFRRAWASSGVVGTYHYMPPEQACGKTADKRSDVFGLGAVLCEILTGKPPYVVPDVKRKAETADLADGYGRLERSGADEELVQIAHACLSVEPKDRPADAGVVAQRIAAYRAGLQKRAEEAKVEQAKAQEAQARLVAERKAADAERSRTRLRRGALGLGLGVAAMAIAVALVFSYWKDAESANEKTTEALQDAKQERQKAEIAQHQTATALRQVKVLNSALEGVNSELKGTNLELESAQKKLLRLSHLHRINLIQQDWQAGKVARARALLDGVDPSECSWEWHYLKGLMHAEVPLATSLPGHIPIHQVFLDETRSLQSDTHDLAISEDGRRLAAAGRDAVKAWDLASGKELFHLTTKGLVPGTLRFSSDGERLAFSTGPLQVWDIASHKRVLSLDGTEKLVMSSNGQRIARPTGQSTEIWDVATSTKLAVLETTATPVLFTPDGGYLVLQASEHGILVWHAGQKEPTKLKYAGNGVAPLAISPDGSLLALAESPPPNGKLLDNAPMKISGKFVDNRPRNLRVWKVVKNEELCQFKERDPFQVVEFSQDGRRLLLGGVTSVQVWDMTEAKEIFHLPYKRQFVRIQGNPYWTGPQNPAALSPDSHYLVLGFTEDKTVRVWDLDRRVLGHQFIGHTDSITQVVFSPDGQRLATASADKRVKVWDHVTGKEPLTLQGHLEAVKKIQFSPDGLWLASTSGHELKAWSTAGAKVVFRLDGRASEVQFSSDGARLVSASGGNLSVWDAATANQLWTQQNWYRPRLSPDGRWLALQRFERDRRFVKICKADTAKDVLFLQDCTHDVFSPDSQWLASVHRTIAGDPGILRIWSATDSKTQELPAAPANARHIAFSLDGKLLAATSPDGNVKVWNTKDRRWLPDLPHRAKITQLIFSPKDARTLVTASEDGLVTLWDAAVGHELRRLAGSPGAVRQLVFSPDGLRLAGTPAGQPAILWDLTTGQHRRLSLLRGNLLFSPNSAILASIVTETPMPDFVDMNALNKTVTLFDAVSGEKLLDLPPVRSVAFSPDSTCLVTADGEGVKLWDLQLFKELLYFAAGHGADAAEFSPDGRRVAAACPDGIRVWDKVGADWQKRVPAWRQQQIALASTVHQWPCIAFHLTWMIRDDPANGLLYGRRGYVQAESGKWQEAGADLARAMDLEPDLSWAWRGRGLVYLQENDHQGYHKLCAKMLDRFGQTNDGSVATVLAWTCVLRPQKLAWPKVVSLMEKAARDHPRQTAYAYTLGASLFRAGRFEDAVKSLDHSIRLHGKGGTAWDALFLAMAHHRLGHADDAKKWLQMTVAKERDPLNSLSLRWEQRLELRLLRQEAEALLKHADE